MDIGNPSAGLGAEYSLKNFHTIAALEGVDAKGWLQMTLSRMILEGTQVQGADEEITYQLTTTAWASSPSAPAVKVFDITAGLRTDVTTTVMPTNSPSAAGDVITLSPLKLLTAGSVYRVEIKFTAGANVFEAYAEVRAEY